MKQYEQSKQYNPIQEAIQTIKTIQSNPKTNPNNLKQCRQLKQSERVQQPRQEVETRQTIQIVRPNPRSNTNNQDYPNNLKTDPNNQNETIQNSKSKSKAIQIIKTIQTIKKTNPNNQNEIVPKVHIKIQSNANNQDKPNN